ncbi:MAG TPA: dATP/dGTP pyrophosphohydrolase domain-containing protein [Blastocatellia bacterium]|nr:dATP/dGTP pyrophosphohydrolase domain-containing protein [Blastocatellia bacterium]
MSEPLTKLSNYLLEHQRGIDVRWTAIVIEEAREQLSEHLQHVEQFLNDMYATMIDPVEQPKMNVAEMCALLLKTAQDQREVAYRAGAESRALQTPRIQNFWNAQAEWSQATFGLDTERDHIGPLKHLAKEAIEAQVRPSDPVEIADCLFLVFDAARRSGMTLDTLIAVAEQKLLVNKARKWAKPTSDDPVEHVREPAPPVQACPDCLGGSCRKHSAGAVQSQDERGRL